MPQLQVRDDDGGRDVAQIPPVDTEQERRYGRVAGTLGLLSVVATFAALPIGASDVGRQAGAANDRTFLLDVGGSGGGQVAALVLRSLGLLLVIAIAVFFYRAIKGRNPAHSGLIAVAGSVSAVIIVACTVYTFFQVRDIGREFVDSGPRTLDRAQDLLEAGRQESTRRVVNVVQGLAGLAFGVWVSLTSLEAMRVGLLTRFLGVFGIGAGLASAVGIPVAPALFIAWIGSLATLAVGYWPGGRPPAWDSGRAVSWDEADAMERSARTARREEREAR
ncbi:DUF4386 family protein [Paraconexibacter sp.]|uniref:DUF4386 family protein n=1 Tax=Paraconexibacter sp. TaxID=2949640 RepID=UPI0035646757